MSKARIREFYEHYDGEVYISFSGGKDSTVLLHLVRSLYPEVEAVFSDTGLEYPEIRDFVKTFDNVTWVKPAKNFKRVVLEHGYPVVSKEISKKVYYARKGSDWALKYVCGEIKDANGNPSKYHLSKRWQKLMDAPFKLSSECCDVMKKRPVAQYEKKCGKHPFLGTMACESHIRSQAWMRTGCNAFESKKPHSTPISFWTDSDVLQYLKEYNIPYCSLYGDIVETGKVIDLMGIQIPEYQTTGLKRTGCMFCMYGAHLEKEPNRFQRMKQTHPKQYEYMMKPVEDGGLGMKEVLDFLGVKYE